MEWASPFSGIVWTLRRITRQDIAFTPKAWPIFDKMLQAAFLQNAQAKDLDEAEREMWRRRAEDLKEKWEAMVKDELAVDRALILGGVHSPHVLDDAEALGKPEIPDPPPGALWYHQVTELDKAQLIRIIVELASGMSADEIEELAAQAANFRDEPRGADDPKDRESSGAAAVGDPVDSQ
jgi:hypothetical protein